MARIQVAADFCIFASFRHENAEIGVGVRYLSANFGIAALEYCIGELASHHPAELAVAVLHNKDKEKRGVIPTEVVHYWAGEQLPDAWIEYPRDCLTRR